MELEQDGLRRQRSARRLRHEAQAQVFENQKGSLEEIRLNLGLRPSQICEILKVHPSAWTRWTRQKRAPPHIYQMLDWYMELLRWRGQHHPLGPAQASSFVRKEDPETYVPTEEPTVQTAATPMEDAPTLFQRLDWRFLFVIWTIQTAVLAILVIYLVNYR